MINKLQDRISEISTDESGFTTAELLANAALGVAALAVIWGFFGTDVFNRVKQIVMDSIH